MSKPIAERFHGTRTGYVYGCRLECCRSAQRKYERDRLRARRPPRPTLREMSEAEVAWLAGLLEGEGHFGIIEGDGSHRTRAVVQMEMTDEDVVRRAHEMTGVGGVSTYDRIGYKKSWKWQVAAQEDVADLLRSIRNWMGQRRAARIEACLQVAVAQLAERDLAKVEAAGSAPVSHS